MRQGWWFDDDGAAILGPERALEFVECGGFHAQEGALAPDILGKEINDLNNISVQPKSAIIIELRN